MGGVVWIASYPRSGNTWIRVFLHALLNVLEGRDEVDLNTLAEFSTWDIASQWYEPLLGKPPDEVTKEAVAAARPMAQRRIADSVDGLVFVKTHAALVKDRGTPTIDMTRTSGAVYVVRNPLDVAISYAKHLGMPIARSVYILSHDGEEAGILMSGQLEIWIDGKNFLLGQGDSFAFKSTLPHRYQNPGPTEAVVIWAITPPSY
jgi:mannose-6-phosphate isomerase-like protein (cupin superfamily)